MPATTRNLQNVADLNEPGPGWCASLWSQWLVLLATILAVGIVLMRWAATTGLQCDELLYLRAIELGPVDGLFAVGSSHPPLFRWVVGAFVSCDSPDWLLRMPSVIASLLTIVIWFKVLRRIFRDSWLVVISLPLMASCGEWLQIGYQLTPYAFLTFLCSLHGLSWLWLLDHNSDRRRRRLDLAWFVLSGAAPFWSHFYGANVVVADQIIWMFLLWHNRKLLRTWLCVSAPILMLAIPMVPLAIYYADLERNLAIVNIEHFATYFLAQSKWLFSRLTLNSTFLGGALIAIWYCMVAAAFVTFVKGRFAADANAVNRAGASFRDHWLIVSGLFLAGFPAMQCHSILFEKAMWARYALIGTWVHWPLLLLAVQSICRSQALPQVAGGMGLLTSLLMLISCQGLTAAWTFDHQPAIRVLAAEAKPGDAFFAQDMDIWAADANFDRLWFERYSPVQLPIISGDTKSRHQLAITGLDFDVATSDIQRIWVCSDLYDAAALREMATPCWRLTMLDETVSRRPLALFARATTRFDGITSSIGL
jgi:hypothetical protein